LPTKLTMRSPSVCRTRLNLSGREPIRFTTPANQRAMSP
jgi:hypothetical protein